MTEPNQQTATVFDWMVREPASRAEWNRLAGEAESLEGFARTISARHRADAVEACGRTLWSEVANHFLDRVDWLWLAERVFDANRTQPN